MQDIVQRMLGAAKLDVATYEEVEKDTDATMQALGVVALVALATGLGSLGHVGFSGVVLGIIASVLGWAVWAGIIWLIGTKLLAEPSTEADWGQVARTTGFAQTPGLLRIFGFVPVVGPLIVLVSGIWQIVAVVIAVRSALDYTATWRAVVVVILGWLVSMLIYAALGVGIGA